MTTAVSRVGIVPYGVGICYASACAPADASIEDIEARVNELHPTGLAHGWKISKDATFTTGQPNPCECNDDASRRHWLLDC